MHRLLLIAEFKYLYILIMWIFKFIDQTSRQRAVNMENQNCWNVFQMSEATNKSIVIDECEILYYILK